jgi:hypothetical protein
LLLSASKAAAAVLAIPGQDKNRSGFNRPRGLEVTIGIADNGHAVEWHAVRAGQLFVETGRRFSAVAASVGMMRAVSNPTHLAAGILNQRA